MPAYYTTALPEVSLFFPLAAAWLTYWALTLLAQFILVMVETKQTGSAANFLTPLLTGLKTLDKSLYFSTKTGFPHL